MDIAACLTQKKRAPSTPAAEESRASQPTGETGDIARCGFRYLVGIDNSTGISMNYLTVPEFGRERAGDYVGSRTVRFQATRSVIASEASARPPALPGVATLVRCVNAGRCARGLAELLRVAT